MSDKYCLTEEKIIVDNVTLYRIKALKDFGNILKGEVGGFIENINNLSQTGNAWVYEDAKVYGNDRIISFSN